MLTPSVGWDVEAKTLFVNHVEVEQDCNLDYPKPMNWSSSTGATFTGFYIFRTSGLLEPRKFVHFLAAHKHTNLETVTENV
jgi:hypothetical protein